MTSSSSTANLLPDESLRISRLDKRYVVLSVSEKGVPLGQGTDYDTLSNTSYDKGYHFFAEHVALTSSIQGPHGLSLATWRLSCPPNSEANSISIDATGEDGVTDGKSSKERNGRRGGPLLVSVQDLDDNSAKAMILTAYGGSGGDAKNSDLVGDGGDGGAIRSVLVPTYVQALDMLQRYFDRAEFHPDDHSHYQDQVVFGDSLYEEARGIVLKAGVLNVAESRVTEIFQPLDDEVSKIKKGEEVRTILDVKRAVNKVKKPMKDLVSEQKFQVASILHDARGGYPGRGINKEVAAGKEGVAGDNIQIFLEPKWTRADLLQATIPFVHPEQCTMLLQRANLFFYMNSPMLRSYARLLYQRLIVRLSFLPLSSNDPLYKAYKDSPIMPKTSIQDLERVFEAAKEQLLHVDSDMNFNGFAPRWVPRANYDFYKQSLSEAYAALVSCQTAYTQYNTALNNQKDLNNDLKLAYDNTSRVVNSLQDDIDDLSNRLVTLDRNIAELKPGVESAKDELIKAYKAEESAIKAAFGLNVSQIASAFTMICFSPSEPMIGLEAGYLVYQGFSEVPSIDGTTIRKEYLASMFQQSEARLKAIKTKLEKRIDGEYTLDDPFAARLITEKDQLLYQLNRFSQEAFGGVKDVDTRKNLEDKFNDYIDKVTTRNGVILRYNVTVKKLCSKKADESIYKDRQTELADRKVKNTDPDLAQITAYVGRIYQASQARMMKLLDLLVRSLNFRMVTHSDIYSYGLSGTDPKRASDLDNVPLTLSAVNLDVIRQNIQGRFGQMKEYWGSEPSKFPADWSSDQGKRYYLSSSQLRTLLKADNPTVIVSIPIVFKESTKPEDFTNCCNVRIYRVRFGLTGLKTASSVGEKEDVLVKFTMTHLGHETIVDRSNAGFAFDHDPVTSLFSFRLKKDGSRTVLDNGNIGECDVNQTESSFAAPGPFAKWVVSMGGTEWSKLDLKDVKKGYFDFCGTNHGYRTAKQK